MGEIGGRKGWKLERDGEGGGEPFRNLRFNIYMVTHPLTTVTPF